MGALVTRALRPIKSFNIENRAHRVISKEKPEPAPKYPSNIEDLKRAIETDPQLDDKLQKKDQGLDDRLKNVYVTSLGRPEDDITREKQNPNRPLPMDRKIIEHFEFGLKEPDKVPYGRTTLRHAIDFISAHQASPDEVTASKIALEYKLNEEDVVDILKYFRTFEVYIPKTKTSAATFAGPATFKNSGKLGITLSEIEANQQKLIEDTSSKSDSKKADSKIQNKS